MLTIVSSFVFGGLLVGGNFMQITVQVPTALIVALNGLVVVFVVAIDYPRRRARRHLQAARELSRAGPPGELVGARPTSVGPEEAPE